MPNSSDEPVVIECAINGETQPDRNPNVPRKPEQIVADVHRCLEAGASIIHAHSGDFSLTGREAAAHEVRLGTDPANLALAGSTDEPSFVADTLDY